MPTFHKAIKEVGIVPISINLNKLLIGTRKSLMFNQKYFFAYLGEPGALGGEIIFC
jgi:hypothetical protein